MLSAQTAKLVSIHQSFPPLAPCFLSSRFFMFYIVRVSRLDFRAYGAAPRGGAHPPSSPGTNRNFFVEYFQECPAIHSKLQMLRNNANFNWRQVYYTDRCPGIVRFLFTGRIFLDWLRNGELLSLVLSEMRGWMGKHCGNEEGNERG